MKIKKETNNLIQIEKFPLHIGIFGWSCLLVVLGRIIYLFLKGMHQETQVFILFIAFLIFFFGGSAFAKKEVFIIKKDEKKIYWSRKGIFGIKKGSILFDKIKDVIIQKTYTNLCFRYRVAIETIDGIIPVSQVYSSGTEENCKEIKDKIIKIIS